jgi:adenylate cyclase class IV
MPLADLFALMPATLTALEISADKDDRNEHDVIALDAIRAVGEFVDVFDADERADYASDTLRRIAEILNRAAVIAARTR